MQKGSVDHNCVLPTGMQQVKGCLLRPKVGRTAAERFPGAVPSWPLAPEERKTSALALYYMHLLCSIGPATAKQETLVHQRSSHLLA